MKLDKNSFSTSVHKGKDSGKVAPAEKLEEEKDGNRYNDFEEPTSSRSEQDAAFEYNEILPKRFTSDGEIFRREHIVEIMFRSKIISEEQEGDVINHLYGGFKNVGIIDPRIIKILVVYNRFQIFKSIIDSKSTSNANSSLLDPSNELINPIYEKVEDATISYETNDIIIEAVVHWLKTDNIPFFNKIFTVFRMRIELRWLEVQKIIIQSFVECLQNKKQINYLFDKIKFVEILTSSVLTEVSIVLEYIQIIKKLIKEDYMLNIFTNYHNPFRLFIMLIKMLLTFEANTESMKIDLDLLQEEIEGVMIQIIDDSESNDILRNWLFDEFAEELKIIDFLAHMELLKILNHPKIAKIAEQVWTGNYDQRK